MLHVRYARTCGARGGAERRDNLASGHDQASRGKRPVKQMVAEKMLQFLVRRHFSHSTHVADMHDNRNTNISVHCHLLRHCTRLSPTPFFAPSRPRPSMLIIPGLHMLNLGTQIGWRLEAIPLLLKRMIKNLVRVREAGILEAKNVKM